MARKELLNKKEKGLSEQSTEAAPKLSGASGKVFGIIKFILGIILLPFVYSTSGAFVGQFGSIDKPLQNYLCWGALTFILIFIFVWEPAVIYGWGHKILEALFSFFKPFVKFAPFLLPVYVIVILILYGIFSNFIRDPWLLQYVLFLSGFFLAMHLVFSSKTIRGNKGDFLKGNYIFGFSFIYIVNLGIMSLGLSFIFKDFSFADFSSDAYTLARDIYYAVFRQLFIR
jgi:hypothetical protein